MGSAGREYSGQRAQLRQPRVAEVVAGLLRDRILDGSLADGDLLPRQEDLLDEFRVSKPSLREALRILEAEGLITVQRGNVGGAVVHVPQDSNVAYTLSLVLQSKHVSVGDVGAALQYLEPVCAAMCAERNDRKRSVLPKLRKAHREALAAIDDELQFTAATHRFHEGFVYCCGNETMIIVAGALESIWSSHAEEWAERATEAGDFPSPETRREGLRVHEQVMALIEEGDASQVSAVMQEHLKSSPLRAQSQLVLSSVLRAPSFGRRPKINSPRARPG